MSDISPPDSGYGPVRRMARSVADVIAAREGASSREDSADNGVIGEDASWDEGSAKTALSGDALDHRRRAQWRLGLLSAAFTMAFCVLGGRVALIAAEDPREPDLNAAQLSASAPIVSRAAIVDREGRVLAANLPAWSLYAHPKEMSDPSGAAHDLAGIFPDLDGDALARRFQDGRRFMWIKRSITPEQRQLAHDLGRPGLYFGHREARIYPSGHVAAHVLGGVSDHRMGADFAETVGVGGVERRFDERLRNPELADTPLRLSLDLTVQAAFRQVLEAGMARFEARGVSGVIMDARSGEVAAMVSLPDFDPNDRPRPPTSGSPEDSPLFNRSAQGRYELGSTFKVFTAALAMETGVAGPETLLNTQAPLRIGRRRIGEAHPMPPLMTLTDAIARSSNVGSARVAMAAGADAQKTLLKGLGFFEPTGIELAEADGITPLRPRRWTELSTATIAFGHGLSATQMHLAAGIATVSNGGYRVRPTLLARDGEVPRGEQVISTDTSRHLRRIMRTVVSDGTGRKAAAPGYEVGGKTGTAEKPKPGGGYYKKKVIATFSGIFPASNPRYVVVVSLDEPIDRSGPILRRTAGWTAAPVAGEAIRRVAPLLGLRPSGAGRPWGEPQIGTHLAAN